MNSLLFKYKCLNLSMAIIFGIVGLIFLLVPDRVLLFFNEISVLAGMTISPVEGKNFYLILAVAYMYLVTLLAYLIYLHPENKILALLLINGKMASSLLSIFMFLKHEPYLIYISNGVIDGMIAVMLMVFYIKLKKSLK